MPAGALLSPGSLCQLLQTQQTRTVLTSRDLDPPPHQRSRKSATCRKPHCLNLSPP